MQEEIGVISLDFRKYKNISVEGRMSNVDITFIGSASSIFHRVLLPINRYLQVMIKGPIVSPTTFAKFQPSK